MISVIIPTYNHASSLLATIESVRVQTERDIEIIIVDDGSTDETSELVRQHTSAWSNASIQFFQIEHAGAPVARNFGARKAKGEYIIFLDADSLLERTMLTKLMTALEQNKKASFAYANYRHGWKFMPARPFSEKALRRGNYIHTSALIRTTHFPGFDVSLKRFQDWDLWLTMAKQGRVGVFVPETLYRVQTIRKGISSWRPKVWYKLCAFVQQLTGYAPLAYCQYMYAREVIAKKHDLTV